MSEEKKIGRTPKENQKTEKNLTLEQLEEIEIQMEIEKEEAELKRQEEAENHNFQDGEILTEEGLPDGQRYNEEGIVMIKIAFPIAPTAGGGFRTVEIPLTLWERVKGRHPQYKDAKEA